jgi:predicted dehydrogenase
MYLKEIQLFMSRAYGPGSYDAAYEKQGRDYPYAYVRWTENRNMEEFLRLVSRGDVRLEPLITHRYPLEQGPQAYQTIMDPASSSLAVLLEYPAPDSAETAGVFAPKRTVAIREESKRTGQVGVALAGAGNLARWAHLPALQKLPDVSLRAVHSTSGVRGKSYGSRFGAAYCTTDYDRLLEDPQIDAVFITSRNQHHAAQALAALKACKHVFVEKPMALTEAECRDLVHASTESGRHVSVGFNRRFAPFYLPLKEKLAKRASPAVLQCRINSPGISGAYWMADPSAGGAILGEACHFVDLMYWLLDSEPVSVSAYTLPTGKRDPIGENNMVACFQFADGSIGNLTYCTVGSRSSGGERVEVYLQGLALHTEDFKQLTICGTARQRRKRMFAEKGYNTQIESFIRDLKNGNTPAVTVEDGARATIGCLRMLESAKDLAPKTVDWNQVVGNHVVAHVVT